MIPKKERKNWTNRAGQPGMPARAGRPGSPTTTTKIKASELYDTTVHENIGPLGPLGAPRDPLGVPWGPLGPHGAPWGPVRPRGAPWGPHWAAPWGPRGPRGPRGPILMHSCVIELGSLYFRRRASGPPCPGWHAWLACPVRPVSILLHQRTHSLRDPGASRKQVPMSSLSTFTPAHV